MLEVDRAKGGGVGETVFEALERRTNEAKNERVFWTEMNLLVDELEQGCAKYGLAERVAALPLDEDLNGSEERKRQRSPIDILEVYLARYRPAIESTQAEWAEAKSQLNAQTFARLMATRYQEQISIVESSLASSKAASPSDTNAMLSRERIRKLEATFEPFFTSHQEIKRHQFTCAKVLGKGTDMLAS